jgi:lipopolysaccharide transport system ATP-binding protein
MMRPIISFQSVSKYYHRRQHRSIRDAFMRLLPARRGPSGLGPDDFWALEDVSFEVTPGEVVGLIGPNGAGKSTSLKLISGVISPTRGAVRVHGRVGALLELGAGFHPELSGRDNVYLNAALLGMSRREARRKFDEIVAFSELEAFLDMPVKHYSSGMFMRLAFSVNIHVDPDILLVDEVLAVGDQDFQRKCLDRISGLKQQGVNIFLVSHAPDTIRALCSRAIWLEQGRVRADGLSDAVVKQYLSQGLERESLRLSQAVTADTSRRWGNRQAEITGVTIVGQQGVESAIFQTGQRLTIDVCYQAHRHIAEPVVGLAIHRQDGFHISGPNTGLAGLKLPSLTTTGRVSYTIPQLPLLDGLYFVSVSLHDPSGINMYDYHDRLYPFRVANLPDNEVREQSGLITLQGVWAYESPATNNGNKARGH